MLRKIAHIILGMLILISSMGMTVSRHYCGNTLKDISIISETKPCCDDVGEEGCCRNETERFELEEDFVPSNVSLEFKAINFDFLLAIVPDILVNIVEKPANTFKVFSPPPPPKLLVFLSNIQVYRL